MKCSWQLLEKWLLKLESQAEVAVTELRY